MLVTDTLFDLKKEIDKPQYCINKQQTKDFLISEVCFSEDGSHFGDLKRGNYTTISFKQPEIDLNCLKLIIKLKLAKHLERSNVNKLLVLGLGNENITADSFGVLVSKRIDVNTSKRYERKIYSISPSVKGLTGIDSDIIVNILNNAIKPDMVIIADSLMTRNVEHLTNLIQISDTPFEFGIKQNPKRRILNNLASDIPVVSIGFPTTIRAHVISAEINSDIIFTSANIDASVDAVSDTVANAINELVSS